MHISSLALLVIAAVSAHAFTPAQVKFQQETLQAHNSLRARHCAPPLQLDSGLNSIAQKYAEELAAQNKFQHSNNGHGENLYMMSGSMSMTNLKGNVATQSWYDEIKDYNFRQPGFTMKTGHFTQVVWKGSQRLGVGIAFANSGRKAVIVTNYQPPGNYMGQFPQQVSEAKC